MQSKVFYYQAECLRGIWNTEMYVTYAVFIASDNRINL
jgi:hypothetical protein